MGHTMEECGDDIHDPEEVDYGDWMVATRRSLPNTQGFGEVVCCMDEWWNEVCDTREGVRCRLWGNTNIPKKRTSKEVGIQTEYGKQDDTAESALKTHVDMEGELQDGMSGARNKLGPSGDRNLSATEESAQKEVQVQVDTMNNATQWLPHALGGGSAVPHPSLEYSAPRDRKRSKQGSSPLKTNNSYK